MIDACRLSWARVVVTPHCDVDVVAAALSNREEERALVLTDSVFSTDGGLALLRRLHEVRRAHGAVLLVDEAHGLGVRGDGGRGLLHEVGLAGAPDIVVTTTLSKALGSQGGAVLGPEALRDHLIDAARPFISDTGLAPAARSVWPRRRCGCWPPNPGGRWPCSPTHAPWPRSATSRESTSRRFRIGGGLGAAG